MALSLEKEASFLLVRSLYRSCADWRHAAAEAKGPKLEDFMSVTCSSNKSSSLYDSCGHAEQANKYHEVHDLQPLSCGSYYHGSSGGIGLGINMNAPPCSGGGGFPDHHHHHQFVSSHHGQYFLGAPVASAGPPGAVPMYNAGGGGGSVSISGIKSWLREAMYVPPERPAAAALSLAVTDDVPAEPPQLLPAAPTPVHRKPAQTFGQRTSQFRGVTRLVAVSCCAAHQRMHAYMIKISLCWFNVVVPRACWLAC